MHFKNETYFLEMEQHTRLALLAARRHAAARYEADLRLLPTAVRDEADPSVLRGSDAGRKLRGRLQ